MIKKKICLLGSYAVGKTSLVRQFVHSIFSDRYLTTIGVKIEQKELEVNGTQLTLLIWDIHGEDTFQKIPASYLKGSSGYFLVMDGTRASTFENLLALKQFADLHIGADKPFIILVNKCDLTQLWEFDKVEGHLNKLGWPWILTSALTGTGVEKAFSELAVSML